MNEYRIHNRNRPTSDDDDDDEMFVCRVFYISELSNIITGDSPFNASDFSAVDFVNQKFPTGKSSLALSVQAKISLKFFISSYTKWSHLTVAQVAISFFSFRGIPDGHRWRSVPIELGGLRAGPSNCAGCEGPMLCDVKSAERPGATQIDGSGKIDK